MEFDFASFIKQYKTGGIQSYYAFENLVLLLLQKLLEEEGKEITIHVRIGEHEIDGLASDGIDDLPGPTLIEIKLTKRIHLDVVHRTFFIAQNNNYNSILLISGNKLTKNDKTRLLNAAKEAKSEIKFKIWDWQDISCLIEKYAESITKLIPEISELAINNVVSKSIKSDPLEWKKKRDKYINNIRDIYKKNDIVLFLGAGVSESAGMPCWTDLISELFVYMIGRRLPENLSVKDKEIRIIARELSRIHGFSPLLEARYLRSGIGNSFVDVVSEFLYKNYSDTNVNKSKLLTSISKLCIPRRSGPGIRSVVTYNFDDLLEAYLKDVGVRHRPIFRDIDIASQDELAIYHVHGFLPRKIDQFEEISESLLVFSEEGYHELFTDPYSWSNIIQLNFFRECTCLMLGLSITDPNLRRLLDIAARKNKSSNHYVFMKRQSTVEFMKNSENTEELTTDVIKGFLAAHHQLQEASYQELGLNIIWIESFDEIPIILESLRD